MTVQIIDYKDIKIDLWDEFALESPYAWFQHTSNWIDICLKLSKQNVNLSFGVFREGQLIAIAPLILMLSNGKKELTFGMCNTPYPAFLGALSDYDRGKIERMVYEKVLTIPDVDYINFYVHPLIDKVLKKEIINNPLSNFGFHNLTISTNVLDLSISEEELLKNMRKGHKSDVIFAAKNGYQVDILGGENYQKEIFDVFRDIHYKAAGRKTRPDETWEIMAGWVKRGLSALALIKENGKYISGAFVNIFDRKAYYQSAATLPGYDNKRGLGHLLQWEIIKYLKSKGVLHYELGWNWYPNISQEVADGKMLGISRFKGGFGAAEFPVFRGEIFNESSLMRKEYQNRVDRYILTRNNKGLEA